MNNLKKEMDLALNALYLELDERIVEDVSNRVYNYISNLEQKLGLAKDGLTKIYAANESDWLNYGDLVDIARSILKDLEEK